MPLSNHGYSSYFFSGLLQAGSGNPPASPTTPTGPHRAATTLSIQVPTPLSPTRTRSGSDSSINKEGRTLRKRRSSMSISAASPVGNVKSPLRSATAAFQRQLLMSPTRSRSGSLNDAMGPPPEPEEQGSSTSFVGRLRSGSLRFPRRVGRKLGAAPNPPPMTPLPPLPGSDTPGPLTAPPLNSAFNFTNVPPLRRRFAQHAHTTDNLDQSTRFGVGVVIDEGQEMLQSPMSHLGPSFAKLGMASSSRMKTPPPCPSSPPLPSSPMSMVDSPIQR